MIDASNTKKQEHSKRNELKSNNNRYNIQRNATKNWYRDFIENYVWKEDETTIA